MAESKYDPRGPKSAQPIQQINQIGPAGYRRQQLGDIAQNRPHAGAKTACDHKYVDILEALRAYCTIERRATVRVHPTLRCTTHTTLETACGCEVNADGAVKVKISVKVAVKAVLRRRSSLASPVTALAAV